MSFLVFVFGLIIGSFLNAVIYRLASGGSIFAKSSQCPKCGHELSWADLVPVVSFFVLGRRCRYCHKPISWQYPVVELATAVVFLLIFYQLPATSYQLVFQLVFVSFLIVIFVYDLKHYLILDKVLIPGVALAMVYQIWQGQFRAAVLGAVLLSGFFGILYLVSRGRWIGLGDVKLGIFLGVLVPWPATLVLVFLAYFLGAAVALPLLLWGAKHLSDRLPFGTFLTLSAFVAMLWGEEIVRWYFKLIGL